MSRGVLVGAALVLAVGGGMHLYQEGVAKRRAAAEKHRAMKEREEELAKMESAKSQATSVAPESAKAPSTGPRIRPASWAQRVVGTDLKNFFRVSGELYRSAQPDEDDMEMLEKMGVKSILNLRDNHDDEDEAEGTTLALYRVEMRAGKILDEDVQRILKIFRDAPKPLLVHCWHGSDRTGLACALWRLGHESWKADDAIEELVSGDFGHHEDIYPNIPDYLRNLDLKKVVSGEGVR